MQNLGSSRGLDQNRRMDPATKRSEPVLPAPHSPSVPLRAEGALCPGKTSATISYRNSYRLGYWREKCPSGSAGVPAEATGRAAPTAVGEPETKADDQHLAYPLAPKIFDSSRIRGPLKSADSIQTKAVAVRASLYRSAGNRSKRHGG